MIALLRTIGFRVAFMAVTIPCVLLALAAVLVGTRAVRRIAITWARLHNVLARWLLGIRIVSQGRVPVVGTVIYAIKHEAAFETVALLDLLGQSPAVVLKEELTRIPFWGRVATLYGVIPVDRAGSSRALRAMLTAARAAKAEGRAILIFPEGTRVPHGEAPPLRPGFAGLYRALDIPVVPVALDSGRVWPREGFVKHAGTITFRFGDPIPAGLARDDIEEQVHEAINALNTTPATA